jgi:2-oxoglutarate ferredoxin oxidoreductase subunit beta
MMKWMRDHTVSIERAREMSDDELKDKIIRGIFVDREAPGYGDKYQQIIRMAQQGG